MKIELTLNEIFTEALKHHCEHYIDDAETALTKGMESICLGFFWLFHLIEGATVEEKLRWWNLTNKAVIKVILKNDENMKGSIN